MSRMDGKKTHTHTHTENTRLPKCVMFGELGGGRGLRKGPEKIMDGVFHHSSLTRCIGWRKNNGADHPISYLDTLIKTGSESIEAALPRRRILFAGFVAMENTRLPKCVMFGESVGGAGYMRGQEKEWMGVSWTASELSASTPTSGQLQPGARGNGAGRWNERQKVLRRNGSLQRNPGLDYCMQ